MSLLLIYEDGTAVTADELDQSIIEGNLCGVLAVYRFEMDCYFELSGHTTSLEDAVWLTVEKSTT